MALPARYSAQTAVPTPLTHLTMRQIHHEHQEVNSSQTAQSHAVIPFARPVPLLNVPFPAQSTRTVSHADSTHSYTPTHHQRSHSLSRRKHGLDDSSG